MKIGSIEIDNNLVMAPLAGISDLPFRLLIKENGCGLVYSEMISANGLVYGSGKTRKMLDSHPVEKPLAVQIFGADPEIMAEAARMVSAAGADILDINFGCSVKKIVKTGAGAALMREPARAESVLKAVRKSVAIPVTIKIRSGWDRTGSQALQIARIAEDSGFDAVAVHPRSATQGFRGRADWEVIRSVKNGIKLPVIGNGDIVSAQDALQMEVETGCDAVMIGRAAIGRPWIFSRILALKAGRSLPPVALEDCIDTMRRYVGAAVQYHGEETACRMLRSRLGWFSKGMPFGSQFRESIKHLSSEGEALDRIKAFRNLLKDESALN
jgi:nifR3 family TIM-barrel protein